MALLAPLLDDDGGFLQTVKEFSVETLVAELAVEGFVVAVLPGAARFDVQGLCSWLCEATSYDLCRHLRTVIGPDVLGHTFGKHHVSHGLDDADAVDPARHIDCQAFPAELVDQRHQSELAPIVGLRLNEVVVPDVVAMLWSQPDAGSVVEPEPTPRPLFLGNF